MLRPHVLLPKGGRRLAATQSTAQPSSSSSKPPVKLTIQPAIKRSPTDILSALASTVGKDTTAPHFQLIDDPAMIPSTLASKKSYFMAKELGKRAARQLSAEWPTLFAFDRDEPRLAAFREQLPPDPLQMPVTEESLIELIEKRAVKDAGILYERIREGGSDVGEETMDKLFHLTAFYNGEDVPMAELEEWPGLRNLGLDHKKKWTTAGVADLVYESLPASPSRKAVLVSALCKHSSPASIKRAKQLFQELETETPTAIPARVYAALMQNESYAECRVLLTKMSRAGVRPDESTWCALLNSTAKITGFANRISALQDVMGEMKALSVVPSLRCFDALLTGLSLEVEGTMKEAESDKRTRIALSALVEILKELEGREKIEIVSSADSNFFVTAMTIVRNAGNLPIAIRIVSLYESKKNEVKLTALGNEGSFYSLYLQLATTQMKEVDELYNLYIDHIPRVVGVSRPLVLSMAQRLNATPHWKALHRLTEDAIASRLMIDGFTGVEIRTLFINTQFESLSPDDRDSFSALVRRLVSIWTEFSRFTDERNRRMQYKWSPQAISECALLLSRIGEREKAWELLNLVCDEDSQRGDGATVHVRGTVKMTCMNELLDDALRRGNGEEAATCMELMARAEMPKQRLEQIAHKITERCKLNAVQSRIVHGFVRLRPQ